MRNSSVAVNCGSEDARGAGFASTRCSTAGLGCSCCATVFFSTATGAGAIGCCGDGACDGAATCCAACGTTCAGAGVAACVGCCGCSVTLAAVVDGVKSCFCSTLGESSSGAGAGMLAVFLT